MSDQSIQRPVRKGEWVAATLPCVGMFDLRIIGNADLADRLKSSGRLLPAAEKVITRHLFPSMETLATVSMVKVSAGNFDAEEREKIIEPEFLKVWSSRHLYSEFVLRLLIVPAPPRLTLARADYECSKRAWFPTAPIPGADSKVRFVSVPCKKGEGVEHRKLDLQDWNPGTRDSIVFAVERRGKHAHMS